jgi:hypothetical protein
MCVCACEFLASCTVNISLEVGAFAVEFVWLGEVAGWSLVGGSGRKYGKKYYIQVFCGYPPCFIRSCFVVSRLLYLTPVAIPRS